MNTNHSFNSDLFHDRQLDDAAFQPKPARFSSEPEGEGMEVFLRGLLVACLLAATAICGARIDRAASTPGSLPETRTAIAYAKPVVAPTAKAL